jgi:hypothetical protein
MPILSSGMLHFTQSHAVAFIAFDDLSRCTRTQAIEKTVVNWTLYTTLRMLQTKSNGEIDASVYVFRADQIELGEVIGKGWWGEVFEGRVTHLQFDCAVKCLKKAHAGEVRE